jgi:hypothetical protein
LLGIWRRARDHFLLEDVERQVRSRLPERQAMVNRYYRAAARRAAVAAELADAHSMASSMLLYRDAVRLFIAAAVTAHDVAADPGALLADANSPWEALAGLSRRAAIEQPPRAVEAAREIVDTNHAPLVFDESAPEQLFAQRTTMKEAVAWLRRLVEPRTLRRIRAERALRVSMLVAIAAAVLALVGSILARPKNLALHKPVSISARLPASLAPEDNSGLVNGSIESAYGIHTKLGGGWAVVDLQSVYRLSEIKIFNRADGWLDAGLPMRLALSDDGRTWNEVERRTTTFSASRPWVFTAQGAGARFVRVASDSYVALTELEVFGVR